MLTAPSARPVRWSTRDGMPKPTAAISGESNSRTAASSPSSSASCDDVGVSRWTVPCTSPLASTTPARIFVPPRSTPMTRLPAMQPGTLLRRMPPDEKPYRVYRGGRAKGKVPAPKGKSRVRGRDGGDGRYRGPGARRTSTGGRLRRVRWRLWIPIAAAAVLGLLIIWGFATYVAVSGGVSSANKRLDPKARAVLVHQGGLLLSHPTTILVLGTDNALLPGRNADQHSDSIMLVHTDPGHHRIAYLSI